MADRAQSGQKLNKVQRFALSSSFSLAITFRTFNLSLVTTMPKAARHTSGPYASTNRKAPYTKTSPKSLSTTDKENVDPKPNSKSRSKNSAPSEDKGDYRDITLDEIKGEIPCYDNAATVRRKLKKLLSDKSTISGTSKKWNQAAMTAEMQELEKRGRPVEYNKNAVNGPSTRSLGNFMKKSGQMGGGDSPCYYWGYVMLEKLRVYNGEKKSKPREKAEEE